MSTQGAVDVITGVQSAVTNKLFADKNNQLAMLTKYAQNIFDGLITINDGNQQSILATYSLIGVANETISDQKSDESILKDNLML